MKRAFNVCLPVLKGFLYCSVLLQVIIGVCYLWGNFNAVPQFKETVTYLEMAEQFIMDEYTGLLYPGLVRLCVSLLGTGYYIPIYLLQIAAGLFCVYHFVCALTERRALAVLCALWLNTIPFVLQMHISVLPHSFAFCCMVLMLLEVIKATVQKRSLTVAEWTVLLCSFTLLCQLTRGYLWAGILFLIWAVALQFLKKENKLLLCLIMILISTGIVVCNIAIYYGTEEAGYYGRIQNTPEAIFFQRTAAPILQEKYMIYMPEEISECFTGRELQLYGKYPYKIQTEMGPTLEARYGKERAAEVYVALGRLGMEVATKDNLLAVAADSLHYGFPQFTYGNWREGSVKGMTGWNYQQFIQNTPILAARYVSISYYLWLTGLGFVIVCFALQVRLRGKIWLRMWLPLVVFLGFYGVVLALRGADLYDYKLALLPMVLCYGPLCVGMFLKKAE